MSEALENALAAVDAFTVVSERDALIRTKVRGLLTGYDAAWFDAGYEAREVERVHQGNLWNPDSIKKSRTFTMAGKLDVLARGPDGRTYVFDHKTTSENITDPDSPYWRQLTIEGQVSQYFLLLWLEGIEPDGAVWDCIRKPSIAPKKLTKAERTLAVADRKYFGRFLGSETLNGLQTDERESLEMYEARLAHDCTVERPEWYFQRRNVPRLKNDIIEYAQDLWETGQLILASRKRKRLPKHSGACMMYGTPCKFLGICSGHDTADSDRWQRKEYRHAELPGVNGDVLTHSRIRCYQLCPVRHRYEYEIGLERVDEEKSESLVFGSLMHTGLEFWWKTFLIGESDATQAVATAQAL